MVCLLTPDAAANRCCDNPASRLSFLRAAPVDNRFVLLMFNSVQLHKQKVKAQLFMAIG